MQLVHIARFSEVERERSRVRVGWTPGRCVGTVDGGERVLAWYDGVVGCGMHALGEVACDGGAVLVGPSSGDY